MDLEKKRNAEAARGANSELKDISDDLLVTQMALFFNGGLEAVANNISTLSYQLAVNPTVQVNNK